MGWLQAAFCGLVASTWLWADVSNPFLPNQDRTLGTQLPEVHFTDDQGKPFLLSDLRGKPLLVSPVFATCKFTCTPITQNLKNALPANWKLGTDYEILTLSFDPDDGVEKMSALRKRANLPPEWKLAIGNPDEVRKMLQTLDFRYLTMEQDGFSHSNFIAAVDKEQRIRYYLLGTNRTPDEVARALEAAAGSSQWKEYARIGFVFFSLSGLIFSSVYFVKLLPKALRRRPA